MSGQIVGEVLAASSALRAGGLSERGFHALVAIAEKAGTDTREASVPWTHISAGLYGASKRTAERAVHDLKRGNLITVVRPGFDNGQGRACAPIYRVHRVTDTDTQVSASANCDTDTRVSVSVDTDTDKPDTDTDKPGDRYRHSGVVLNGSLNGSPNREPACSFCRDDGWLLGPDSTPVEPAIKCNHTQAMTRYTA